VTRVLGFESDLVRNLGLGETLTAGPFCWGLISSSQLKRPHLSTRLLSAPRVGGGCLRRCLAAAVRETDYMPVYRVSGWLGSLWIEGRRTCVTYFT
jgi:hypothetical protein